jgi:serine/threonine-protein kinase RsbT
MSAEAPLRSETDIVLARQLVRKLAQQVGFSLVDQTKIVTATSEIARNCLIYGGGGVMQYEILNAGNRRGLRLSFIDEGPGIADVDLALTDGWTSGGGLGLGLSGTRRLVNEFDIDSKVGVGTRVTIARWTKCP